MHVDVSALVPLGERDTTVAALMFDILEPADQVGYAAEAETGAEDEGPDTVEGRMN